jgi:bacterioferritin-associated ferredoxin
LAAARSASSQGPANSESAVRNGVSAGGYGCIGSLETGARLPGREPVQAFDPIICVCLGITEDTIARVIAEGASDLEQIRARCGANTVCGSCRYDLEELLDEYA